MQIPILVAIISVAGSLLDTVVGGTIVITGDYYLTSMKEKSEFRAACRLVAFELLEASNTVYSAVGIKRWWLPDTDPRLDAWKEYKHVLASNLPAHVWLDLQLSVFAINHVNVQAKFFRPSNDPAHTMSAERADIITSSRDILEEGHIILEPCLL